MSSMFKGDTPFYQVLTKLFDVILLNALFVICCIPVVTIGSSMTALYYMTMKMIKDEEPGIIKGFFRAFKENFKQSFPMTLLLLLMAVILGGDLYILGNSESPYNTILFGGGVVLLMIVAAIASYAFPMLARFENTVKNTLTNAAKLALAYLPYTAIFLLVNVGPIVWFILSPETFSHVFKIWICIGIGGGAYLNSIFLLRIFEKLTPDEEQTVE